MTSADSEPLRTCRHPNSLPAGNGRTEELLTAVSIGIIGLLAGGVTAVLGAFASPFTDTGDRMVRIGGFLMVVSAIFLAYALGYITEKH